MELQIPSLDGLKFDTRKFNSVDVLINGLNAWSLDQIVLVKKDRVEKVFFFESKVSLIIRLSDATLFV